MKANKKVIITESQKRFLMELMERNGQIQELLNVSPKEIYVDVRNITNTKYQVFPIIGNKIIDKEIVDFILEEKPCKSRNTIFYVAEVSVNDELKDLGFEEKLLTACVLQGLDIAFTMETALSPKFRNILMNISEECHRALKGTRTDDGTMISYFENPK